jgi:hypothetical protein
MLGWLIVLCPLAIAICPAAPPLVVVAARSATGVVTDRAVPTALRQGRWPARRPDQRDCAQVVGCAGRSGLRVCAGWRGAAGLMVVAAGFRASNRGAYFARLTVGGTSPR